MKIGLTSHGDSAVAWFETGAALELRVALSPRLALEPLTTRLVAQGWCRHEGVQQHMDTEGVRSSVLFSRKWNGTTQVQTRAKAAEIFFEEICAQLRALERTTAAPARRRAPTDRRQVAFA